MFIISDMFLYALVYFVTAVFALHLIACWIVLFYGAYSNLREWMSLPAGARLKLRQEFE